MSIATVTVIGLIVGIWLAYQWGSAAITKYKRDNDLN